MSSGLLQRLFFWWAYLTGHAPWDTGITPPEIVALIEGERMPPGRAIDLGCGTGTNVIYLAQHGWQAVGVDFVPSAIRMACRKAKRAGVAGQTQFIRADVTHLDRLNLGDPFDLALDIGCGHSLPPDAQRVYAHTLAHIMRPGGTFMLYMFRPTPQRPRGLEPEAVERLFAPAFQLVWSSLGEDHAAGSGAAWYRFKRAEAG